MGRLPQHLLGRARLHDLAVAHHQHLVGVLAVLSAFGFYLAGLHQRVGSDEDVASVARATNVEMNRPDAAQAAEFEQAGEAALTHEGPQPALPAPAVHIMTAARWAVERLDFVNGGSVLLAVAIADYRACAAAAGREPLPEREFRQALIGAVLDLELEIHGHELRGVALPSSQR